MSAISNYAEKKLLDHVLGTTAFTKPAAVYVALFSSNPAEDGSGTELAGNGYARQLVTFSAAVDGAGTESVAKSSGDLEFGPATASWGSVTHMAIFDAVSGGNMLWFGPLTVAKTIDLNDSLKINSTNLSCSLD